MYIYHLDGYYSWLDGNFATIDAADAYPNNGAIDRTFYARSGDTRGRIVVAWMNRGTWTYAHSSDPYPIGMNFDLVLYDPNGNWVQTVWNAYDGFAVMEFTPTVLGKYHLMIRLLTQRDNDALLKMGYAVKID